MSDDTERDDWTPKDPVRDGLVKELRALRREPGIPRIERLTGKHLLIETLGMGDVARSWERLEQLREEHGSDQAADIGAYFYLAGWGVGRDTLDQRIQRYAEVQHCNPRTGLRRADRGATKLAAIIRDQAEYTRPWGLITVFQSGERADVITRLMLGRESWRHPTIQLNGDDVADPQFTVHQNADVEGGLFHQFIAQCVPLDLNVTEFERMLSLYVHWPMPVWPTWQIAAYVADPRIIVRSRSFHSRAFEVWLEWSRSETASKCLPLVHDQRIWVDSTDPHVQQLPDSWRRDRV